MAQFSELLSHISLNLYFIPTFLTNWINIAWAPKHCIFNEFIQRQIIITFFRCQTSFWFGVRKHHCRSCGNLVCGDCSKNSLPLPSEQLYHPVRICDACFSKKSTTTSGDQNDADDSKIDVLSLSENGEFKVDEEDDETICPASDIIAAQLSEWRDDW